MNSRRHRCPRTACSTSLDRAQRVRAHNCGCRHRRRWMNCRSTSSLLDTVLPGSPISDAGSSGSPRLLHRPRSEHGHQGRRRGDERTGLVVDAAAASFITGDTTPASSATPPSHTSTGGASDTAAVRRGHGAKPRSRPGRVVADGPRPHRRPRGVQQRRGPCGDAGHTPPPLTTTPDRKSVV